MPAPVEAQGGSSSSTAVFLPPQGTVRAKVGSVLKLDDGTGTADVLLGLSSAKLGVDFESVQVGVGWHACRCSCCLLI